MSEIKLYNGDCLEVMKQIPDNSVDLVLTDPPYGITASEWDKIIPFDKLWNQLNRITKPFGTVLLFCSNNFLFKVHDSNIKDFKYLLYWEKSKSSNVLHSKNKPCQKIECISVFSKGSIAHKSLSNSRMTYNPQGIISNGFSKISEKFAKNRSNTLGGLDLIKLVKYMKVLRIFQVIY